MTSWVCNVVVIKRNTWYFLTRCCTKTIRGSSCASIRTKILVRIEAHLVFWWNFGDVVAEVKYGLFSKLEPWGGSWSIEYNSRFAKKQFSEQLRLGVKFHCAPNLNCSRWLSWPNFSCRAGWPEKLKILSFFYVWNTLEFHSPSWRSYPE